MPAYLRSRAGGDTVVMPILDIVSRQAEGQERLVRGEEVCATAEYVVKALASDLYVELMALFHHCKA